MNSSSNLAVKWDDTPDVEFSRTALVVIRNALVELCNGSYYPLGDPELATIIGYERHELQAALDRVNQILSLGPRSIDEEGLVRTISRDGSRVSFRPNADDITMYSLAVTHVEFMCAVNRHDDRGAGFEGVRNLNDAEKEEALLSKVGASAADVQALKLRLRKLAFPS